MSSRQTGTKRNEVSITKKGKGGDGGGEMVLLTNVGLVG